MRTLVELIAVLLADGSIDKNRYTVSFTEDKDVVEKYTKNFSEINGIKLNWKLDAQENSMRARVYSKNLCEFLYQKISSFRTRPIGIHPTTLIQQPTIEEQQHPKITLPGFIINDKENALTFLQAFATCDGGPEFSVYERNGNILQLHMAIKIGCDNPSLRKQILDMLKSMEINSRERKDGITIKKLSEIRKFYEKIGFLNESKVRRGKLLKGFRKNDVVKLMLICGKLSEEGQWINRNFENKESFQGFLKDCMNTLVNSSEKDLPISGIQSKLAPYVRKKGCPLPSP